MPTKIEETIRKLLRLAQSDNLNESANAAKRAQLLMEKHRIEVCLDVDETYDFAEPLERFKRAVPWKGNLVDVICEVNGCRGLWAIVGDEIHLVVAGPKRDCDAVRYLYRYLVREIARLCAQEVKEKTEAAKRDRSGPFGQLKSPIGTKWRHSFRYGAIAIITLRLTEARNEAWTEAQAENPHALAVIEKRSAQLDAITKWVEDRTDLEDSPDIVSDLDMDAFNRGMRAAEDLPLGDREQLGDGDAASSDG